MAAALSLSLERVSMQTSLLPGQAQQVSQYSAKCAADLIADSGTRSELSLPLADKVS